ncbi:phage tail tape measure protein [Flindersiella endophytica]
MAKVAGFVAGMRTASKSAADFSNKLLDGANKHSDKLNTLSNTAGVFGLALVGAAAAAVKSFADFDAGMSKVQAATHASAADMDLLRGAALKAGKETAFSATEAAAAIEELAKAGVSTADILGGGLDGALSLAAAGEMEVAEAAETAATALVQFKLKGADIPHVADLLAAGAGKAQGSVQDLAMALKQGGLVAAQAGLSIDETVGTMSAFASAGLLGSDAGTSFKTMLLALMNPSKEAADLMADLGITAYDANGSFVGMSDLAQQLKVRLGGLGEEQRNAALATIFGSDAIRAASVLYQQGGKGIQDWTGKVNDAGYAAETAALKTDNLKGDLERLGGSIETALIEGGEGANTAARDIVQSLTAIVDAFIELPNAAQQTVLMGTIFLGSAGLVAAGAIKGVTALAEFRAALTGLGIAGRTAVLGMGALGVVLGAGAYIVSKYAQENADAASRVEELTATLDQQTGAVTENTRALALKRLRDAGLIDDAERLGISLNDLVDAQLGNADAWERVNTALTAAETGTDRVTGALLSQGSPLDQATGGVKGLDDAWAAAGETGTATADTVGRFRDVWSSTKGELATARKEIEQNSAAGVENAGATGGMTDAVQMSEKAFKDQADAVSPAAEMLGTMDNRAKALRESLDILNGTLSSQAAQSNYEQSIDAVTERLAAYREEVKNGDAATKGMKGAFDLGSQAGRDNAAVLRDVWERAGEVAEQTMRLTGNQEDANKVMTAGRAQLVDMATKFLGSKEAAETYVTEILGIPKGVSTTVTAPGLQSALDKARLLYGKVTELDGKIVRSYVNIYHTDFYSSIRDTNPKRGGQKSPGKAQAAGGPTSTDRVTLVGEEGPELVRFGQRGWVSTAAQTASIMSGLAAGDNPWTGHGGKPFQRMPMTAHAGGSSTEPGVVNNHHTFNMKRIDLNERTFQRAQRVAQVRERVGRQR